jgi:hypothetical protein
VLFFAAAATAAGAQTPGAAPARRALFGFVHNAAGRPIDRAEVIVGAPRRSGVHGNSSMATIIAWLRK